MGIDLFEHIAQVAPGFIGVAAAKFMDYDTRTDSVADCLSKYFLFAGASWLCTMALAELLGYAGLSPAGNALTAISMLIALTLGLLWHDIILPKAVKLHNRLNRQLGKNEGFMKNTIIEQLLDDCKAHYLIVYKGNEVIASGWVTTALAHEKSFLLSPSPEWEEWFKANNIPHRFLIYRGEEVYYKEYTLTDEMLGDGEICMK